MSGPQTVSDSPAVSVVRDDEDTDRPGRRRRSVVVLTVVLVVVVTAGTGGAVYLNHRQRAAPNSAPALATAEITRGDVVDTDSVDGKLIYPGTLSIPAAATGVITWLPNQGAMISRGQSLYRVDNEPVTLMYGALPLYRTLTRGISKGPDVRQLESNLKALGYGDGLTVDDKFTAATARAVKAWQKARGLTRSGSVDASQVQFEAGPVRVGTVNLATGDRSGGGALMSVTATRPIVQVALDPGKRDLVRRGTTVGVELPAGNTVTGRITKVGTVASTDKDGNSSIDVDISLSSRKIGPVDEAPVSVDLVSARAHSVLSVPVEALLGLREGGFGVELVDGGSTRIVPVRTGVYGETRVEVTGDGLEPGQKVEVPSS